MFVFSRIFLGHGIVYAIIAGAALLGELGHPKERAFLGSLFNAFFGVGAVLGAGIVVQTRLIQNDWSWRLPSILQAIPSLIQIGFSFTVPESPRCKFNDGEIVECMLNRQGWCRRIGTRRHFRSSSSIMRKEMHRQNSRTSNSPRFKPR
jgi:MFS family permease